MVLRIIQSDVCEACGHIPLSGRLMRLFLQVIAVLLFAGGLASFRHSPLAGIFICVIACALFVVATHQLSTKVKLWLEVTRKIFARTSRWALGFLFLVLIIVPAWLWWDASFQSAYTWARVDLMIPDETGAGLLELNSMGASYLEAAGKPTLYRKMHSLSVLGPRIGVMIFILCGSVIALLLAGTHIILRGASKKYLVGYLLVVCGLVAVVSQQNNLQWYAVRYRVSNDLPRFERVLEPLLQEWPTTSGTLPGIGKYFAHEKLPGQVIIRGETPYGFGETIGAPIIKLPDEGVSVPLSPHYLFQLEYHPPESGPLAIVPSRFWTYHLTRSDRIAEGWYLTEYGAVRN